MVICGGGTGGHIHPGLAVARELERMEVPVSWLGCAGGMEAKLVGATSIGFAAVGYAAPAGGALGRLGALARLARPAWVARDILAKLNAGVVLGLGGYPSLPGVVATLGTDIRRLIHEQNVTPGAANRLLAPLAHRILTSSRQTFARRRQASFTGNPVRAAFAGHPAPAQRFAGRSGPLRLLVIGGSQGASSLNRALPAALAANGVAGRWQVVHAAGSPQAAASLTAAYINAGVSVEVKSFIDDIAARMAAADLMICRGGASTLAELACVGLGAIVVPYPFAGAHQQANAAELVAAGAAVELGDAQLDARLAELLASLSDRSKLEAMATRARGLQPANAAKEVARACAEELGDV